MTPIILTAFHKLLLIVTPIVWATANVARLAKWLGLDGEHIR